MAKKFFVPISAFVTVCECEVARWRLGGNLALPGCLVRFRKIEVLNKSNMKIKVYFILMKRKVIIFSELEIESSASQFPPDHQPPWITSANYVTRYVLLQVSWKYTTDLTQEKNLLPVISVIRYSPKLVTWRDTRSSILEKSHLPATYVNNHSPKLVTWKDTSSNTLETNHLFATHVHSYSPKIVTWKDTSSATLERSHLPATRVENHSPKLVAWRHISSYTLDRSHLSATHANSQCPNLVIWRDTKSSVFACNTCEQ